MQFNQGNHALPSLLSILSNKFGSIPPDSVVNASTINLICKLLSSEDYISVAEQLSQDSDVRNLVDFMLHLLRDGLLPNLDETLGIKRRARRLMFKIISKIPVIPSSLIVTGVNMPEKRDYIGSGGFGRVFKGELQGEVVALKVLYKSDNNVAFCREALMWRSLTHRSVLPFLGIHELEDGTTPQFFLVSPYMTNGNLAQWRKKTNPSVAEVEERIIEVAQGMEYIHSEGVVHGDLRGENILLDAKVHVQIADFGLTRLSEATNTRSGGLHLNFAAPELFGFCDDENGSSEDVPPRTQMSDVYAFGCLYYEIHYDSIPFAGKQDIQIWTLISRGTLPPRSDGPPLSDRAWSVILSCWTREASKRPRMNDITESMLSMTQPVSLPIEARDSFQELVELRMIPAQTLVVLRQELGLDDRDPSQMTSAERHRLWAYHQQRKPDSTEPMDGLRSQNPAQLRTQQPQRRLKRSSSETQEEKQRGVGRINSPPPQKRRRPSPEQPPTQGMGHPQQPPQPGEPGISGQHPLKMTRAPPQMNGPRTGGVSQGRQVSIDNPMNMDLGHPSLGNEHQLDVPLPQGHTNGVVARQQQVYSSENRKSEGVTPQDMNRDLYGSTNPEVKNEQVALENEDLEAKIEQATSENENLRDLLARMQSENMMLKQQQPFSVPKNAGNGLERMRDSFMGSTPTAPSSRMLAWSSPPIEYTTSDWSSLLASFNPPMLSGLDESPQTTAAGGELSIDFGSGTSSDASAGFPFTTIGSNPAFFSLASTFDAGTPAHQGNHLAPSSNDHNFDFGPLAPWPTSNNEDTSFNDLFNGSYMPSSKSGDYNPFLSNTPESTPLPRHMESNPSSSSSASFAASPSDLLRIPVQDTDPHRSERLKSRNARQKDIEAEGSSPFAPPASLHTPSNLSTALKKTLDNNSTPIITASGSEFPKTQRSDKNIEVLTAWRTTTSNPKFPKIQRSDKNIDVLTAWRTITSNPKFKIRTLT